MQKSFTLIELMTVVGIIAILAGLMLVGYNIFFSETNIGSSMRFDSSIHHSLGYALVGDWKLDDNAANSTVVDTSGNGNDGTFYSNGSEDNTVNHSVDGANGRALEFDGVDDTVLVPETDNFDFSTTNAITITLWLNLNETGLERGDNLDIILDDGLDHIIYCTPSSKLAWRINDSEGINHILYSDQLIEKNQWYHISVTWDGEKQIVYINGCKDHSVSFTATIKGDTGGMLTINKGSTSNRWVNGKLDQVRVYKDALSTSQIKQQYYTGLQRLYKKGLISREEYIKRIVQK